jgi:hypothetical protein
MTTKLLESLFEKVAALPPALQDDLARQWLDELEDERRWDNSFANSQEALDTLAQRALRRHREGKTIPKGIDEL